MRHSGIFNRICAVLMVSLSIVLMAFSYTRADFSYNSLRCDIPFTCERADVTGDNTYDVVIESLTEGNPMPANNVLTLQGGGTGSFAIDVNEPGTYIYKIYQRSGSNPDIVYDDTIYNVTLFVTTDDNGVLDCKVILSKGGLVKPTEVKFINSAARAPLASLSSTVSTGEAVSILGICGLMAIGLGVILFVAVARKRKEAQDESAS